MSNACGAKTRNGGTCKKPPLTGKSRCKLHGGKSSGAIDAARPGNSNAATHGIYQQHLTPPEREQYNALRLGAVDDELRLTRIRLSRALAAENNAANLPELEEVTQNDGGGENLARESRKLKVRDYTSIIDRLTARIESLEKTRQTLSANLPPDDDNDLMRDDTFIAPDEAIPDKPIL